MERGILTVRVCVERGILTVRVCIERGILTVGVCMERGISRPSQLEYVRREGFSLLLW